MRRVTVAVALVIALAGCGRSRGASPSEGSVDTTTTGSTSTSVTHSTTTVSSTTIVPDGLPTRVLGITGSPVAQPFGGTELDLVDRTTASSVAVLTAGELHQLFTFGSPLITAADLSPDGHHAVANITWDPGHDPYQALVYVNLDDPSSPRALSQPAPDDSSATVKVSPDGKSVARFGQSLSIVTIADATTAATSIKLPYAAVGMAWSPNGKQLAWGNHYERDAHLSSSVATVKLPGSAQAVTITSQDGPGVGPWWDNIGRLHGTGSSATQNFAVDTDRTHTWVLGQCGDNNHQSVGACWWHATDTEGSAQALAGLPANFVPMTW